MQPAVIKEVTNQFHSVFEIQSYKYNSPEHYPMNWSWISGKVTNEEHREKDYLEKKLI